MIKTRFIAIDPAAADDARIGEVAGALLAGAVAAYPTETFYALGAAAFSKKAVAKIYRLKKRDPLKPLPLIASGLDMVKDITAFLPPSFVAIAGEFWPGPLTLVLPAAAGVPENVLGPGRTIAVRVPPLAWLRALVREASEPLTATSANISGGKALADPAEVSALFNGKVGLIIDGGPAPGGLPSTILDLAADRPRVLREGAVPSDRIRRVLDF